MSHPREVIVIGGGASGLTAAIFAAENGAKVTILEQNDRLGKKISVTGNGRCNLTNRDMRAEIFRGSDPHFISSVLKQFSLRDTLDFFEEIGVAPTEKNGWFYPRSGQAKCVPELLERKARALKIKIKTRECAEELFQKGNRWFVKTATWTYEGDAVILANGSRASLVSGSGESGYQLAKKLGHKVIEPLPALVGLKCKGNSWKSWAGVRTAARVSLYVEDQLITSDTGEIQLTDYGVSGIPVFQISRYAVIALAEGKTVSLKINFFPEKTETELSDYLKKRMEAGDWKNEQDCLTGLLPDKLIKAVQKQKKLTEALTAFPLTVIGSTGFSQAQICCGGVDTSEIDEHTMESRLHKGLYMVGELLNIDGPCGGYNLQWAWSSGAVAGRASAKENL